jgi:hypothetical protein
MGILLYASAWLGYGVPGWIFRKFLDSDHPVRFVLWIAGLAGGWGAVVALAAWLGRRHKLVDR